VKKKAPEVMNMVNYSFS